ncbi:putative stress response protein NST1-like [Capsicum annuum]|nr:putative stress response protein NST1-like [Capsicum annuum]
MSLPMNTCDSVRDFIENSDGGDSSKAHLLRSNKGSSSMSHQCSACIGVVEVGSLNADQGREIFGAYASSGEMGQQVDLKMSLPMDAPTSNVIQDSVGNSAEGDSSKPYWLRSAAKKSDHKNAANCSTYKASKSVAPRPKKSKQKKKSSATPMKSTTVLENSCGSGGRIKKPYRRLMMRADNHPSKNGVISESNEIVNKTPFDFEEYESNSLAMPSLTLGLVHTTNNTIIVAQDVVIIFADASLQKEKNIASIGMAAMDSSGNLLQALGTPIQFVGKTIIAEALAIRIALEKAQENVWTKVQILSDAKNVVDMVIKSSVASWKIDTTCEDI